jgi:hypothetical protein
MTIRLQDIRENMCRWIEGSEPANGATFCGEPTPPNSSWCDFHRAIVYQPLKPLAKKEEVSK